MHLPVLADPADPVLSLDDAKEALVVEHDDHDDLIEAFVQAATNHVERLAGIVLGDQTWEQSFDGFCRTIRLSKGPVTELQGVSYKNAAGTTVPVDISNLDLVTDALGSYVRFKDAFRAPSDLYEVGAVKVTWSAGDDVVPAPLLAAIKMIAGELYANREATIDGSLQINPVVASLISTYRVFA